MVAYCLFDVCEVSDETAMAEYRARVGAVVAAHGGRYVAVGGPARPVEGTRSFRFPVMIAFPDMAAAEAWYASADYRDLLTLRRRAARTEAVFIEGLPEVEPSPKLHATHDLYGFVHKGLRRAAMRLLDGIGTAAWDEAGAVDGLLAGLTRFLSLSEAHLRHEDTEIHPVLEQRMPGASRVLSEDHHTHRMLQAGLAELIGRLRQASGPARSRAGMELYSRFAEYMAADFAHMAREEAQVLPLLQAVFTDAELQAIEVRILAAMSAAEADAFLREILPALNPAERADLLRSLPVPVAQSVSAT